MFEKIFLKECTELNHDQQFKIKIFIVFQMCAKLKKKIILMTPLSTCSLVMMLNNLALGIAKKNVFFLHD